MFAGEIEAHGLATTIGEDLLGQSFLSKSYRILRMFLPDIADAGSTEPVSIRTQNDLFL